MPNAYHPPMRDADGVSLPAAAKARFGGGAICPSCRGRMQDKPTRRFQAPPPDKKTIGHDFSVAKGGDPSVWVYQCNRCNGDQGSLDLVTWSRKLVQCGDPRAEHVIELAEFVRPWVAANTRSPK